MSAPGANLDRRAPKQALTDVQRWQGALMGERGPKATMRHILLTLSVRMKKNGDRAFPSVRQIRVRTGLSQNTIIKWLREARQQGWVRILERRKRKPGGRSGSRHHQYLPAIPGETLTHVQQLEESLLREGAVLVTGEVAEVRGASSDAGVGAIAGGVAATSEPQSPEPLQRSSTEGSRSGSRKSPSQFVLFSKTPPSGECNDGRDDDEAWLKKARAVLVEHCLLGRQDGRDQNGRPFTIGLLLVQFGERVKAGSDPWELLGAVEQVRRDEDAPPPDAAFSFRWFDAGPGRLERCIGAFHKGQVGHPYVSVQLRSIPTGVRRADSRAEVQRGLQELRRREAM